MTGYLAHCLVKQARVHYGVHSGRIHMWFSSMDALYEISGLIQLINLQEGFPIGCKPPACRPKFCYNVHVLACFRREKLSTVMPWGEGDKGRVWD